MVRRLTTTQTKSQIGRELLEFLMRITRNNPVVDEEVEAFQEWVFEVVDSFDAEISGCNIELRYLRKLFHALNVSNHLLNPGFKGSVWDKLESLLPAEHSSWFNPTDKVQSGSVQRTQLANELKQGGKLEILGSWERPRASTKKTNPSKREKLLTHLIRCIALCVEYDWPDKRSDGAAHFARRKDNGQKTALTTNAVINSQVESGSFAAAVAAIGVGN